MYILQLYYHNCNISYHISPVVTYTYTPAYMYKCNMYIFEYAYYLSCICTYYFLYILVYLMQPTCHVVFIQYPTCQEPVATTPMALPCACESACESSRGSLYHPRLNKKLRCKNGSEVGHGWSDRKC